MLKGIGAETLAIPADVSKGKNPMPTIRSFFEIPLSALALSLENQFSVASVSFKLMSSLVNAHPFVIMVYSYDDISLLVSHVNISVGFDNLFPWICSINNRFELSRLNQLFKKDQISRLFVCWTSNGKKVSIFPKNAFAILR